MSIVPTDVPMTPELADSLVDRLAAEYPFLRAETLASTAYGRPIRTLTIGTGGRRVLYSAAHHANEWLTATVLLKFAEDYAEAIRTGGMIGGVSAEELSGAATISLVPMVNPDGVALVTGAATPEEQEQARELSRNYPNIPFPDGWKANVRGVDLNLQYPAAWEQAREIKFAQGYTRPAPRDYVGTEPLTQPEARAMVRLTELCSPDRILAYHTQGQVIYPQFKDFDPPDSMPIAWRLAAASGYDVEPTPPESAAAGYKDWFIQTYNRPGYTIEAGKGVSPLPLEDFDSIYAANLPIMVLTAVL